MSKIERTLKNKKGFTLVELITVIVILGILMALVVPTFHSMMERADNINMEGAVRNLYTSACVNVIAVGKYPDADFDEKEATHENGKPTYTTGIKDIADLTINGRSFET